MNTKTYSYTYDDCETKDVHTMLEEILNDPELPKLEEIVIGCWGECWEDNCQPLLDGIVANKEKFMHIKSLFIGDMDYEECEVSWIMQGNYEELLKALPNLEALTIKGSSELVLGEIHHENLRELEIICGGLPKNVLVSIKNAYLPNLRKLNLYIGIEDYGFDGDLEDVLGVLENSSFKNLEYLGLGDSDIQDEIVEGVMAANWPENLKVLDFSNGTLSDKGAQALIDHKERLEKLETVDLTYHYLTDKMQEKLSRLAVNVILEDGQEILDEDDEDYDYYKYPMLTE